jgi:nucleoside-diphosphate-sugar epimerase
LFINLQPGSYPLSRSEVPTVAAVDSNNTPLYNVSGRMGAVIAVTGATGHVGNVLVRDLLARRSSVRALVLPGDDQRPLANLDVEFIHGDVTDLASLESAFAGADIVFHLAGIVTIMPGMSRLLERVNVGGIRNVVAACRTTGVRRLVYTSSIHAIAEPPHGFWVITPAARPVPPCCCSTR